MITCEFCRSRYVVDEDALREIAPPAGGGRGERVSGGCGRSAPSSGRTHGPPSRRTAIPTSKKRKTAAPAARRGRSQRLAALRRSPRSRAAAAPARAAGQVPQAPPAEGRLAAGESSRSAMGVADGFAMDRLAAPAEAPARAEEGGPRDRLGGVRRGRARPRPRSPAGSGPTSSSGSRRAACSWAARSPRRSAWTSSPSGSRSAGATRRAADGARCEFPDLSGKKVLVVDDVAASGATLAKARAVARKAGAREVRTAVLVVRPDGARPDFSFIETDELVLFGWDYQLDGAGAGRRRSGRGRRLAQFSGAPPAHMKRVVVGTAGHIDHGKTSLVRALTGIDTDRLREEKRRGITIELGFAHLAAARRHGGGRGRRPRPRAVRPRDGGRRGRHRSRGARHRGGRGRHAADPRAPRHLPPARRARGLVAITKSDLLPGLGADWLPLLEQDVRDATKGTFLEGASIVPVSAASGEGLDRLRAELARIAREVPERPADGPVFLPIDRAFSMKGFGTVVTGTLLSGQIAEGDEAALLPAAPGAPALRVRTVQVHGKPAARALAGQRTAVNLPGVEASAIARGQALVHAGIVPQSSMLDVEVSLARRGAAPAQASREAPPPRRHGPGPRGGRARRPRRAPPRRHRVRAAPARRAGGRAPRAALHPARLHGAPGPRQDRRGRPDPRRRGPAPAPRQAGGAAAAGGARARRSRRARRGGARDGRARRARAGRPRRAHRALGEGGAGGARPPRREGRALLFDRERRSYVAGPVAHALAERLVAAVDAFHAAHPLAAGVGREELRGSLPPVTDARLFQRLLAQLAERGSSSSTATSFAGRGTPPRPAPSPGR